MRQNPLAAGQGGQRQPEGRLAGEGWESPFVLTFSRIRTKGRAEGWTDTKEEASFRVVLEPR